MSSRTSAILRALAGQPRPTHAIVLFERLHPEGDLEELERHGDVLAGLIDSGLVRGVDPSSAQVGPHVHAVWSSYAITERGLEYLRGLDEASLVLELELDERARSLELEPCHWTAPPARSGVRWPLILWPAALLLVYLAIVWRGCRAS